MNVWPHAVCFLCFVVSLLDPVQQQQQGFHGFPGLIVCVGAAGRLRGRGSACQCEEEEEEDEEDGGVCVCVGGLSRLAPALLGGSSGPMLPTSLLNHSSSDSPDSCLSRRRVEMSCSCTPVFTVPPP